MKKLLIILILILNSAYLSIKAVENKSAALILDIEEISKTDLGLVSTDVKQFRLNIDYLEDLIAENDREQLKTNSSIFLRGLRIISRPLLKKNKTPKSILDKFKFNFEAESESPNSGYKRVSYISDDLLLKQAARINFKIDLVDYLENRQTIKVNEFQTKSNEKININGLEQGFSNLSLDNGSLFFDKRSGTKKSKLESETVNLIGSLSSSKNLSNIIKRKQFRTVDAVDKTIRAKLRDTSKNQSLNLKVINTIDQIENKFIGESNYEITIPIVLRTKKKLKAQEINNFSDYDNLVIPVFINTKTGDGLDIRISGTLRQKLDITSTVITEEDESSTKQK